MRQAFRIFITTDEKLNENQIRLALQRFSKLIEEVDVEELIIGA
jgi:hypothetical protein